MQSIKYVNSELTYVKVLTYVNALMYAKYDPM